jgi:exopolysaccharide production protein ExoZ
MNNRLSVQAGNSDDHKRLPYLQALRGIAATLVVLDHGYDGLLHYHASPPPWTAVLPSFGYFGVATFFIISGFIIFRVEYHAFNANRAGLYLKKRLIRIYPIYWIATLLFIALTPKLHLYNVGSIASSLVLLPHYNALTATMYPLLGPGWTLQYEIMFYVLFFMALFFRRRLGVVLLLAILVLAVGLGSLSLPLLSVTQPITIFQYWTRPIILLFGIGILVGWLERSGSVRIKCRYPLLVVLALVGGYAISQQYLPPAALNDQYSRFFAWPFCLICVLACVFAPKIEGRTEALATRLGDASYSTYLFHIFILSALLRVHALLHHPLFFLFLTVVLSNCLGLLAYNFVERPMLRVLRPATKMAALATVPG